MAFNDGIYLTVSQYVYSSCDILEQISRIEAIQLQIEMKMLDAAAGSSDIDEYQMDDGQMKVRTKYRSVADMQSGWLALEKQRIALVNRVNGRTTVRRGGIF